MGSGLGPGATRVAMATLGNSPKARVPPADTGFCDMCGVHCSGNLSQHFVGKRHLKRLAEMAKRNPRTTEVVTAATEDLASPQDVEVITVEDDSRPCGSSWGRSGKIEIPNGYKKPSLTLSVPNQSLLPRRSRPKELVYKVDLNSLRQSTRGRPCYEQLEMLNTYCSEEPPAKRRKAGPKGFFCSLCDLHLDTDYELLNHIRGEEHSTKTRELSDKNNLDYVIVEDDADDVIVEDDANDEGRKRKERQRSRLKNKPIVVKPCRGFWPAVKMTRPLAVSQDNYPLIYNFGHHQKPGPKTAAQHQTFPPGFLVRKKGSEQKGSRRNVERSVRRTGRNSFSSNFVSVIQNDHGSKKRRGQRIGSPDCVDVISDDDAIEYDDNNDGMVQGEDNDGDVAASHDISSLIPAEMV